MGRKSGRGPMEQTYGTVGGREGCTCILCIEVLHFGPPAKVSTWSPHGQGAEVAGSRGAEVAHG